MAHGRIDYYVLKRWRSPDELFHRTIAEFVHEWSRTQSREPRELEPLVGVGVFYGGSISEPHALAGEEVYVVGGGNSAGQAALGLARYADRVTIVVRRPSLAEAMASYLREQISAARNIEVLTRTEVADGAATGGSSGSRCETASHARSCRPPPRPSSS
jgi:hypothetical protein